jgi:hypothetical protein
MRVKRIIQQTGKTTTGIELSADIIEALGGGKRPPVKVAINGYTYRTTVGVVNGKSMLSVSAEHREAGGVAAGDEVTVDIELDTTPRVVEIPPELAFALDAEPSARATFESLSYSNKAWHVHQVTSAKTDETRKRRINKSVSTLAEGRAR